MVLLARGSVTVTAVNDGVPEKLYRAWSNNADGSGYSTTDSSGKYLGTYVGLSEPTSASQYKWTLIKGETGETGQPGVSAYLHTAWANSANGQTGFSTSVSTDKLYIGTYSSSSPTPSQSYTSYKWVRVKGLDAKFYSVIVDKSFLNRNGLSSTATETIKINSYVHEGNSAGVAAPGFFIIKEQIKQTTAGATTYVFQEKHRSTTAVSQLNYTVSAKAVTVKIEFYLTNQFNNLFAVRDIGVLMDASTDIEARVPIAQLIENINNHPSTTKISGAKMHFTSDVTFDQSFHTKLFAETGFIENLGAYEFSADNIKTGTLKADHIKGGTLDFDLFHAKHFSADSLTSGTIDASIVNIDNLSASRIKTGNLDVSSGLKITSGNHQIMSIDPETLNLEFNVNEMSIGGVKLISEDDQPQMEKNIATELENKIKPYLHIAYANNATGTLGFSISDSLNKLYIGTYTDYISTHSTDPSKYSWTLIKGDKGETGAKGATGDRGPQGAAGVSVKSITEYYLATSAASGVTSATGGWTTTIQTMTTTNKYLWNYELVNFSDGSTQPTLPVIVGVYGDKGQTGSTGATGRSITAITEHYLATNLASGVTRSTSGWTTTMQTTTSDKKYLWNYETITWSSGTTTTYVEPIIIGIHGETGPTGATGATGPKGATGSQGPKGNTGTSVSSVTEYYLATASNTGVTTSTSGWTTTIQTMTATNKYLWNYEQINFSDGTNQPTLPVIIGAYGDKGQTGSTGATGRSITGITEHYLASNLATGVTRTTSGWTTTMQQTDPTKKYLWNYETITWSSGTTTTYVEPIVIGVHGEQGPKGDTGAKGATGSQGPQGNVGTSVTGITEHYLATSASSGVTAATSGWTTSIQTMTATNKYLWNYEKVNFSDGTNQPTIPVIVGVYGDKGDTGSTGATGRSITAIQEYYLSTSASTGVTRSTSGWKTTMQTTTPTNKYLWNYEKITWSSGTTTTYVEPIIIGIHGEKGEIGNTGVGLQSITEWYLATPLKEGVTRATTGWTESIQTLSSVNNYLWNYEQVNYDNGTKHYTDPTIIGTFGEQGISVKGVTEYYLASPLSKGITKDTPGWTTDIQPLTPENKYLWNKEIVHYSDDAVFLDKTEVLSGTEIWTDKADDNAVVHVEVDGKSYQSETGDNLSVNGNFANDLSNWYVNGTASIDNIDGMKVIKLQGSNAGFYQYPSKGIHGYHEISFKAKSVGASSDIKYGFLNKGTGASKSQSITGNWQTYSYRTGIKIGPAKELYHFYATANTKEGVYITDITVKPIGPTPDNPIKIHSLNNVDVVSSKATRNLLPNSGNFTNMLGWTSTSTIVNKDGFSVLETTGTAYQNTNQIQILEPNTEYIVTAEFMFDTACSISSSVPVHVYAKTATGTNFGVATGLSVVGGSRTVRPNVWETVSVTFKTLDISEPIFFKFHLYTPSTPMTKWLKNVSVRKGKSELPWTPALEDIQPDTYTPTLYKINLLLDEPLRSVGDVKDRLFRDTDALWKVERNVDIINNTTGYNSFSLSETSTGRPDLNRFNASLSLNSVAGYGNAISSHVPSHTNSSFGSVIEESVDVHPGSGAITFFLNSDRASTSTELRNWMSSNNVEIQYIVEPRIEILDQELQDKLNNLHSFKDSNYVYAVLPDKSNILSENLKPTLHATFKSKAWAGNSAGYPSIIGVYGDSAKLLYLSTSADSMTFNSDGSANPASQTITFTGNLQNVSGNVIFTAIAYNGTTVVSTISLSGVGNTRTLTQAQFPASADRIQVKATLGNLEDTVTIVKLKNGADAIVGYLTNESITLAANTAGTVASFTNATGTFKVFEGLIDRTSPATFRVKSQSGATAAINNSSGVYTVSAMSADMATVVFEATYNGVKIDQTLSLAKSKEGAKGSQGVSITKVDVEYYLHTSATVVPPTTGWSTTAPAWVDGRYMWSRTVTTYSSGDPTISTPVCITGAKGATGGTGSTGATGRGVSSIVEQFYLSTSKTTQTGGSWSTTMPTWSPGKYVWTRSLITYTTGTPATSTTEPLVSSEWEAINELEIGGRNLFTNSGNFQNITNWSGVAIAYEGGVPYLTGSGTLTNVSDMPLEPGAEYVFTAKLRFNIEFPIGNSTPNHIYIRYPGESAFSALDGAISLISNETQTISGQWHVISLRFKTKPDTSKIPGLKFHAYTSNTPSVKDILWVKLEKGNKATDWNPAPEDVEAAYTAVAEAKAEAERIKAEVYADGKVTAEEEARIADVNDKLVAAKQYANNINKVQDMGGGNKKFINVGHITSKTSSHRGYLVIKTPFTSPYMVKMKISGYNYTQGKTDIDLNVGFYAYTGSNILQYSYMSNGDYPYSKVQLARDTNDRVVIIAGVESDSYSYPAITIDEALVSFSTPPDSFKDGFSMEITSDISMYSIKVNNVPGGDTKLNISAAQTAANNAQSTANTARDSASTANNLLADIASDSKLTATEKKAAKKEWDIIVGEKPKIDSSADTYGITTQKTAYNTAYSTLNTYLSSLLANLNTTSNIVGTTFRANFKAYYDARQDLLNKIADGAKSLVDKLEIGGRNLIPYTQTQRYIGGILFNDGLLEITHSGSIIKANKGYSSSLPGWKVELTGTVQLTFSGKILSSTSNIICYWRAYDSSGNTTLAQTSFPINIDGNGLFNHTRTFNLGSNTSYIILGVGYVDSPIEMQLKVEKGNKATDWTPAPEDTTIDINKKTYNPVRYIRDWANGSTANTSNHWYEIQAIDTSGNNIALGKTVKSNASTSLFPVVTDGNTAGTFASGGSNMKAYMEVDLGSVYYNISEIKVWRYHNDGRTYYDTKTEVSEDGNNWYPIFDSKIEDEYSETSAGRTFPNTQAKSEGLLAAYHTTERLESATSKVVINGGNITAGRIQDSLKRNDLNLDNGTFKLANGNIEYDGTALKIKTGVQFAALPTDTQTKINAGAVAEANAKKYVDDNTGNLVNNPAVTGNHTGWSGSGLSSLNQTFEGVSTRVLQASTSSDVQYYSSYFKVDPSKAYEVSAWFKKSVANSSGYYFGLTGIDTSGSNIGFVETPQTGGVSNANNTNFYFDYGTASTNWVKVVGYIMPVGTNASYLKGVGTKWNAIMKQNIDRIRVRFLNWNNGGTTRQLWVANPKVVEVDPNAIITAAQAKTLTDTWVHPGTTQINGSNIRTGTLSAGTITTGILSANKGTSTLNMDTGDMVMNGNFNLGAGALQWNKTSKTLSIKANTLKIGSYDAASKNDVSSSLSSAKDYTEQAVQNIELGGRNLALNSNVTTSSSRGGYFSLTLNEWKQLRGKQITVSTHINLVNGATNQTQNRLGAEFSITYVDGTVVYYGAWHSLSYGSNYVGRASRTYTILDKEISTVSPWGIHVQIAGSVREVSNPKIELGNKATDWSPATEDLYQYVDNVEVGGDNLLRVGEWYNYPQYNSIPMVTNGGRTITYVKNNSNSVAIRNVPLEYGPNIYYTISGYAKINETPVTNATWGVNKLASTYQGKVTHFSIRDSDGYFVITQNWNASSQWLFHGSSIIQTSTGTVTIDDFMVQRGTKATSWKLNPLDAQGGGRNYALGTQGELTLSGWAAQYNLSPDITDLNGLPATVSFWAKHHSGSSSVAMHVYYRTPGGTNLGYSYGSSQKTTTSYQKFVIPIDTAYIPSDLSGYSTLAIRKDDYTNTISIKGVKLEVGYGSTDYSPAIEDVQSSIGSKADGSATESALNEAAAKLQVLQQEVEAAATSNELKDFIDKYNKDMASRDKDARESESSLSTALASISSIQTNMGNMSATWQFIDRFIKNTPQGIVVGNDSSGSYILIKEDRLAFYSNGQEVAFISQNLMEISRGAFVEQIQIAKYQFEESTANHLTIRYVG